MRVLAYLRVSTSEQVDSGASLEAQRAAIQAECERRGWELIETIEDCGYSAKYLNRPGVQTALEALTRGDADALVVARLDRLSRSKLDFAGFMAAAQKESWGLVALDLNVDTTIPAGEMMATIMATFAQFERRLIGQRTKDALAAKRRAGVRLGRPRSLPPEVERRVARDRQSGMTMQAIADALNADGVPTATGKNWRAGTVYVVLKRAGS